MIYLGDKKIGTVYLGDKKLSKIYLGDKLIWEGYPEGHIIGTMPFKNSSNEFNFNDSVGTARSLTVSTDADGNFDMNLQDDYFFKGKMSTEAGLYTGNNAGMFSTIKSMTVTLVQPNSSYDLVFFNNMNSLIEVNINSTKLILSEKAANGKISMEHSFDYCSKLETIKAGHFPWNKVGMLYSTFCTLPALKLLDLSGADFSNINLDDNDVFKNIGSAGTIIKLTGCSKDTKSKIFNAVTNHDGQYSDRKWEMSGDVITRIS